MADVVDLALKVKDKAERRVIDALVAAYLGQGDPPKKFLAAMKPLASWTEPSPAACDALAAVVAAMLGTIVVAKNKSATKHGKAIARAYLATLAFGRSKKHEKASHAALCELAALAKDAELARLLA